MVRRHPCLRFIPLHAFSVSDTDRQIRPSDDYNEVVIGPRDNGFSGPAVALDGPAAELDKHILEHSSLEQTVNLLCAQANSASYPQ